MPKKLDLRKLTEAVVDHKAIPGAVFLVDDAAFRFPETPPEHRTTHKYRRGILVQAAKFNIEGGAPGTVLMVPCSASETGEVGPYDLAIPVGTPGFTKAAVAYVHLVQPVTKIDLAHHVGNVPREVLTAIRDRLYELLSLSKGAHTTG